MPETSHAKQASNIKSKQTSLLNFFKSPKKVNGATPEANTERSSSASSGFSGLDSTELLSVVEQAEEEYYGSPSKGKKNAVQPSNRKRKLGNAKPQRRRHTFYESSDEGSDTVEEADGSDDDDDADEDFIPDDLNENGKSESALPLKPENVSTTAKRPRLERTSATGSSDGPTLLSLMQGARKPGLTKQETSGISNGTSVSSVPLMQRTHNHQYASISETSKKQRASNFAKKNEERYSWLDDVRDAQKLRPTDPGYDKRTLFIPPSAWAKFSPFEKQYWEIKSKHWDTVVFFKKGKFYELYENDATIGHQEFDLRMTDRVNMRMAGVPESSFDHWTAQFIAKGYKIARVDQMESRLAKDMRERGSTKKSDSLVIRELTGVLTAGTLVDPSLLTQDLATYCLAIVEAVQDSNINTSDTCNTVTSFGVAFVDTSTAQFHICSITNDDADRSGLETLLVQINPREVIYVRGGAGPGQRNVSVLTATSSTLGSTVDEGTLTSPDAWDGMAGLSQATWRALKSSCSQNTDWISMTGRKEFWDLPTTKREIKQAQYFSDAVEDSDNDSSEYHDWPEALKDAAKSNSLSLIALGGLLSYLRTLKLDKDLASLKNFALYRPIQQSNALVLDGPTISNLDLFTISSESGGSAIRDGNGVSSEEGTLFSLIDHTITPFGRRTLQRWSLHPLRNAESINARLDCVDFFISNGEFSDMILDTFGKLADLERTLSRVHYKRCKTLDFISLLDGIGAAAGLIKNISSTYGESLPARLQTLVRIFPSSVENVLEKFSASFDRGQAVSEGKLLPFPGNDPEYDEVLAQIGELDAWLEAHLKENRKKLGCASIVYKNMGKEHYQLEMPTSIKVPSNYFRLSATKSVNRYWSPELRVKVREHAEALELKSIRLEGYQARLYSRFDRHYALFMKAISIIAELDALRALSVASMSLGTPYSRPTILDNNNGEGGYIEFKQLRHPCVALLGKVSNFVPNDIVLGRRSSIPENDGASMILLTGPNMGGKSTLLRQLCLGVILAQLGCYVPAESARLTPVDRLFTRIGARDHLLAGRSTFMVEMAETSTILRYATPQSLVVLDELGRGTSTHDGEAVAYGVLHGLCSRLGCLGLFSTHYGLLAESLLDSEMNADSLDSIPRKSIEPHLRPMYMACSINEEEHRVTFLYRLQRGVASRSHGMNVAAMAGIPISIVEQAHKIAEKFEHGIKERQRETRRRELYEGVVSSEAQNRAPDSIPLSLQSDFANLLHMADLERSNIDKNGDSKSHCTLDSAVDKNSGGRNDTGDYNSVYPSTIGEGPIGGANGAKRANENQYWSCLVDHLCATMAAEPN